jgi:hypothetical protein
MDGMSAGKIDLWERNQCASHLYMLAIC